jgi:hypothetical protein
MDLSADPWAGIDPRSTNVNQAAMAQRYGPHWQAGVSGPHSNVWRDALREAFAARTARWPVVYSEWDGIPIGREVDDARYSLDPRVLQAPSSAVTVTVTVPSGEFKPGQPLTVTWETTGTVASYTVSLSIDDGPFNDLADAPRTARSFAITLPSVTSTSRGVVQVAAKDRSRTQVGKGISRQFTIKPESTGIKVPDDVKETLRILTAAKGRFVIGPGRAARIQRLADWVRGLGVEVPEDVKETLRILTAVRGPFVIGPGRTLRIRRLSDWVLGLEKPPA